jgi:hypothetical protein
VRKLLAVIGVTIAFAAAAQRADAVNDAAAGYETIRPSLVKVWAFDRGGRPNESGTGIVVESDAQRSLVLTATHVVAGAASIRIDLSRDVHDVSARVVHAGPRDLTLLSIERGNLRAAHFAARDRPVVEGNLVAVAGYVKNDELIGVVGQAPRILYPGTVASRPDNGLYLELENVHIEEGLSGGAVFDPATGDVLGVVTSRTSDRRGGFADSGALVVLPFLDKNRLIALAPPPAPPRPPLSRAAEPLPAFAPRPAPTATLQAVIGRIAAPPRISGDVDSWQATNPAPKRFIAMRGGCRTAITIDVQTLQFLIAHQALVTPHRRGELLTIALQRRSGAAYGCDRVADVDPVNGSYEPTAMSFDGRHVTMRFVYAGDAQYADAFPADASVDADLDDAAPTATVQFFDRDWSGTIAVSLDHTSLASVSSTW